MVYNPDYSPRIVSEEEAVGFPTSAEVRQAVTHVQFYRDSEPVPLEDLALRYVSGAGFLGENEKTPLVIVAPEDIAVNLHPDSSGDRVIVSCDLPADMKSVALIFHSPPIISHDGALSSRSLREHDAISVTINDAPDANGAYHYLGQCVLTPDGDPISGIYLHPEYVLLFVGITGNVPGLHHRLLQGDLELGGAVVVNAPME